MKTAGMKNTILAPARPCQYTLYHISELSCSSRAVPCCVACLRQVSVLCCAAFQIAINHGIFIVRDAIL